MAGRQSPDSRSYTNGDILSQQQFTDVILSQENIGALTLATMSYGIPLNEISNARSVHAKLLSLADEGTHVRVSIDDTYGRRMTPKNDLPVGLAPLVGQEALVRLRREAHRQLGENPNIDFSYSGAEEHKLFPLHDIDHRKLLHVTGGSHPDFALIFGFSINHQLDGGVIDSALYITDPEAVAWVGIQPDTPHTNEPTKVEINDFTFITREFSEHGNDLADAEVIDAINSAKDSIMFCTQFIPDGEVLDSLAAAADRGVNISIYTNFPPFMRQPIYSFFRFMQIKRLADIRGRQNIRVYVPKDPNMYFHLKALITDIHNPSMSVALTGSDDMTNRRLHQLGTKEIMVRLNRQEHREALYTYITSRLDELTVLFDYEQLNLMALLRGANIDESQ